MRKRCVPGWRGVWRVMAVLVAAGLPALGVAAEAQVRTNAFRFVDLSRLTGATGPDAPVAREFANAPKGLQVFNGVPFLLGAPLAVTGIESARAGQLYPSDVAGLEVGKKVKRLFLLHSTLSAEGDGVPMAKLVWHYANGAEETSRIGYGVHARAWMKPRLEKKTGLLDPNSRIAWHEGGPNERGNEVRLFQTALENPRPDDILAGIDVVSLFSRATPLIFAISAESGDSGLPPNRPVSSRKVTRELHEFGDSIYRREIVIRVTDGLAGDLLTNAVADLTLTDDDQTYFFGEARTDARGICRLPYPPQQMVAFSLLVRAPNHIPFTASESRTNRAAFTREFQAPLARGVTAGGVVKNPDGKAIPGVEVSIHRVVKSGPRVYTRTDYDTALTDMAGKWSSSSFPPGFEGFSFQLSHPDHKPALYTMPGFAEPPTNRPASGNSRNVSYQRLDDGSLVTIQTQESLGPVRPAPARPASIPLVTSNALLSGAAEMTLQPGILVSGTVLDSSGKPIPAAEVVFQRNSPFYERKFLRTDDRGRFRMMASEAGDGTLNVSRSGQSPKYEMVNIQPGLAPIEIRLTPPRVLRGRVVDRQHRPVDGAKVRLDEWQGTSDLLHFQALTDEQGRFAWTGAPPDQLTFFLSKSNCYNMRQSVSGSSDELTLILNRWPGASGKVYDAETKKPIDSFSIIKGRKYSPNESQIHWDRQDAFRGHKGDYSIRIDDYYFQPEARIMVEAPGYLPEISKGWLAADSYTNDFALKPGRGISGVVQLADGTPVPSATVLLLDKSESGYMDASGQFRNTSSGGDMTRSDVRGRFEFSPKLEADMILASHEQGYAEIKASQVESSGRVVLQAWGRVKGVMRVGDKPGSDQWVRLQHRYDRGYDSGQRSSFLSLYLKADPDEAGNFVFEKVPPGDRRIYVEYRLNENNQRETPLSHGLPLLVKPGETAEVTLGGSGRSVVGRVKVLGGEQSDVDWRRDVHKLTLVVPAKTIAPPDVSKLRTPEEQQRAWAEFNRRQNEFWRSDAGRAIELLERTYVLLFDTNGSFHADNVPPGKYTLQMSVSDPTEEYYRQRQIGNLMQEVVVLDKPGARINEPLDIGTLELRIQSLLRVGKAAPPFDGQSLDGKPIKLSDFRGQPVLLYFWASLAVSTPDLQILKELHKTYGAEQKLVILGMNLDADVKVAQQFVKDNGLLWPQAHLGDWGQTQVPGLFGVDGYPVAMLIDGEGKLAARQLRGSSIRTAVRNTIARQLKIKN